MTRKAHTAWLTWRAQKSRILFTVPRRSVHGVELNDAGVIVESKGIARQVVPTKVKFIFRSS